MANLSFDDGLIDVTINNDPSRVIRFNPGDMNIINRYNEVIKKLNNMEPEKEPDATEDDFEVASRQLKYMDKILREQLNYLFNADVYDIIFNGQSPLCVVGTEKQFLCEAVIESIGNMIAEACGKSVDEINMKMNKYTAKYKPKDHKKKGAK